MTGLSDPPTSLPPAKSFGRRFLTRLVPSILLGALFVWFLQRAGVGVMPSRSDFDHVQWWTVGAYFALYGVVHYFRAARWDYLLRPIAHVPTRKIVSYGFIGFLAVMVLPLRMGEFVRPLLVRKRTDISGTAALGTIAAERVLDGLYVALLLAGALLFVPRRPLEGVRLGAFEIARVPQAGYLTVAVFSAALTVLAFFLWKRDLAEKLTRAVVGVVSPRLADVLSAKVRSLADGLRSLPDPKLMAPFTFQSGIYWCANALTMWLLGWGCGLPMTAGQGFAVMGVLAMGILLPAAPGLFGAFQLAVFSALLMYFPESVVFHQGRAYVFLMYVAQLAFHVIAGVIPMITEKISPADLFGTGSDAEKLS